MTGSAVGYAVWHSSPAAPQQRRIERRETREAAQNTVLAIQLRFVGGVAVTVVKKFAAGVQMLVARYPIAGFAGANLLRRP